MEKLTISRDRDFDLSCLGILVLDVFGSPINCFPQKGTSEYFDRMEIHPGGCAYNTGVDSARLGMKTCILGKVGTDPFGDIILNSMEKENIDISKVTKSDDSSTAFSFVMVPDDGHRRIYHSYGVNTFFSLVDVCTKTIASSSILHIAGASLMPSLDGEPTVELLQFAKMNGVVTSMDPVVKPGIKDLILPCLQYLDVFLPNNDESFYITGLSDPMKQLEFYTKRCPGITGIKLGSKGCLISDGERILRLGVYDVPVVDTCGAGDAFIAGFLYGVLQGWGIEITARFATAAASFCVQSIGATTAIPGAQDVLKYIKENELEECNVCQL
jgi:sugar/nucleoside kinase (ribokinase family)